MITGEPGGEKANTDHPEMWRQALGSSAPVAPACLQLLQRQKEVLQEQYEQVEKLRRQLVELEDLLSAFQMQASGFSHGPRPKSSDLPDRNLGVSDLQPLESDEEEDGCLCWSLDPRDYQ